MVPAAGRQSTPRIGYSATRRGSRDCSIMRSAAHPGPGERINVMPTIDAQVHAYERDHPGRPWAAVLHGPKEVTGDQMVAAMDAVGVDGALLISPVTMYRWDASYAIEAQKAATGRDAMSNADDEAEPGV